MNFTKRFRLAAVTAVTLVSTLALSAPASAASCLTLGNTTVRPTYSYVLKVTWSQLFGRNVQTTTQQTSKTPTQQTTKTPAQQTTKTPAQQTTKTPAQQQTQTPTQQQTSTPAQTNTQTSAAGLTAAEQQMLDLVNAERTKNGLQPLQADMELTKLARMKSQDMINRGYFDHNSPTYGSPFDMMKQYGVTYKTAGENLAGNRSVQAAHTALMNSAGHRANILNSSFTHIGIGIVEGGSYGMMFTQMFVGR